MFGIVSLKMSSLGLPFCLAHLPDDLSTVSMVLSEARMGWCRECGFSRPPYPSIGVNPELPMLIDVMFGVDGCGRCVVSFTVWFGVNLHP